MNNPFKLSAVQNWDRKYVRRSSARARRYLFGVGIVLVIMWGVSLYLFHPAPHTTRAIDPEISALTLYELVANGQGDVAMQQLTALAKARGGWEPAPGDRVVFVPTMRFTVASTIAIDKPPQDCASLDRTAPRSPDCGRDFQYEQDLVRFSPETFARRLRDGTFAPRANLDDILSVYIEEVGHSWQEYCYETEGRCQGERTRLTTWGEGKQRAAGWEYQVKMYILSLDGTWLELSDREGAELTGAICAGYANARYSVVSEYGPEL